MMKMKNEKWQLRFAVPRAVSMVAKATRLAATRHLFRRCRRRRRRTFQ